MEVDYAGTIPICDPVLRQKNAIDIIKALVNADALMDALFELLHQRDVNGHTPFISAIQNRAYGAAALIWSAMLRLYGHLESKLCFKR